MQATIVDLSHYQVAVDFQQMKAAGILAVILKATEGADYVDPTFAERRQAASEAGLTNLSYHFLRAGDVPTQVAHYLSTVQPVAGERLICDFEDDSLDLSYLRAFCKSLIDRQGNYQVTVYGGSVLKSLMGDKKDYWLAQNTSLWLAQYTEGTPSWPKATWPHYSMWQFTDCADIAGVDGFCDGNIFNGSDENALLYLMPAGSPAPPAPPPSKAVQMILTLDADQLVDVTLNCSTNVRIAGLAPTS